VHVVAFFEGSPGAQGSSPGSAGVDVQVTDRPVILVLCAHDSIRWDVKVADGARVPRIILSGDHAQQLVETPAGTAVESRTRADGYADYFFAEQAEGRPYARLIRSVTALTGLPIATFQGEHRYGGNPVVLSSQDPDFQCRRLTTEMEPLYLEATAYERAARRQADAAVRFGAIHWDTAPRPAGTPPRGQWVECSPVGWMSAGARPLPAGVNRVAVDPRGLTYYGIVGHRSVGRLDLRTGEVTRLDVDPKLPELSWPCGIAFDTKRNRLVITTLGGVGHMYAFSPDTGTWALLGTMRYVDIESLTYSAADDCFYGLDRPMGETRTPRIHRFAPDGKALGMANLPESLPNDAGVAHYAPNQLVAAGRSLYLLTSPGWLAGREAIPVRCLRVDPATGLFTAAQVLRSIVPVERLDEGELVHRWTALRDAEPGAAVDAAIERLAAGGEAAVTLIGARMPAAGAVDAARVNDLVAALAREDWRARESAAAELRLLAGAIGPQLSAALAGAGEPEVRARLQGLIEYARTPAATAGVELDGVIRDPEQRSRLRAIRVLERLGIPAAVDALQRVAAGRAGTLGVAQAREALREM
jgi:hypothetical protein